jgi:GT2 family glycosyltransferase
LKTSVIVATHDRPASIARLVESLAPQLTPSARELIIADNGTPAPTLIADSSRVAMHVHDPRAGKCRVQNRAISAARGDIIVFLDDDLTASSGYIDAVEDFFDRYPEYVAMKGRILAAENPASVAGAMAPYLDLPISDHGDNVCEVRGVLGANMAFRAEAIRKVGQFDERLGPGACGHEEETEMSARIRAAGLKIGYAPRALVLHEVDPSRARRDRFIRISRERGRCRMIHERHSRGEVFLKVAIAAVRLAIARAMFASIERRAREERRLAIARGMIDGLAR